MSILSYFTRRDFEIKTARRKYGFTLAEILITLVIIGFIAALGVPMLGQQKMKKPNVTQLEHGVFECYYAPDGSLHQFTANNKNNKDGTDTVVAGGNFCHFDPPTANYFAITAVGAGGRGGLFNNSPYVPDYSEVVDSSSINIPTDDSFFKALHTNLPDEFSWLLDLRDNGQTNWDFAAPSNRVQYTLTPDVGGGGDSDADVGRMNNAPDGSICATCNVNNKECPSYCLIVSKYSGGNSGTWYQLYTSNITLNSNTQVTYNLPSAERNYTELLIGSTGRALLYNVPGGGNAGCHKNAQGICTYYYNGPDGTAHTPPHICSGLSCSKGPNNVQQGATTVSGHPEYDSVSGESAVAPSIKASPDHITCFYQFKKIKPTFGEGGKPANTMTRVYEKLPSNGIDLFPAQNSLDTTRAVLNTDFGSRPVVIARPADAGASVRITDNDDAIEIKSNAVLPFPEEWLKQANRKSPDIQSFRDPTVRSALVDLENNQGYIPGASGYGGYPFIGSISVAGLTKRIGNRTVSGASGVSYTTTATKCLNGEDPIPYGSRTYCAATEGNRGAVIIAW